jgi:glycosyltransferase involved in cell wall biosynthesis
MLRLCADSRDTLRDRRGIGRYVRELLRRFAAAEDVELTLVVDTPLPVLQTAGYRATLGSRRFRLVKRVGDADVFWHPLNGTFCETSLPAVATIHDVVPFAYPHPDPRKRRSQQHPFLRSARAHAVITDSRFSASEIARHLGVAEERITVIPLGVDEAFRPGPASPPAVLQGRRYILAVATLEPHKNLATLLTGFGRARFDADVVLAVRGALPSSIDRVVSLEAMDDAALPALYRGALFVAAPGLYEGFGLPALEAMACGTPVLAARAGALPEVCADAAAYVDAPQSPDAWSAALGRLAGDERRRIELRTLGIARAAPFTWDRTAELTLRVLRACARAGRDFAPATGTRN